jgi:Fe-S-cluster-containing dehydrogenase component
MIEKRLEYGLLIDYDYCTGCHTCEVACAQEFGHPPGIRGIRVLEVEQKLPNDGAYLSYIPFPTETCVLRPHLTREGCEPACVKHCMSGCMKYGRIEELAGELREKPRMVLWTPRASAHVKHHQ